MSSDRELLVDALESMVRQHCATAVEGEYDSMAISANAEAMDALEQERRFKIDHEVGRRVIGRFVKVAPDVAD
mgnify:CR=1 FL=1